MMTVRKRASLVCVKDGKMLMVLLRDPKTKIVKKFPPGGEIEPDEQPFETASRECLEETGVSVQVHKALSVSRRYPFQWNGQLYDCHTIYFKGEFKEIVNKDIDDAEYNEGIEWVSLKEAINELSFDKNIQSSVIEILDLHDRKN